MGRDPGRLAQDLTAAGAPVLSVVTEPDHFGGSAELMERIAAATSVPILRKDFIHHRRQLRETLRLGASAVLLISSMLEEKALLDLVEEATALGLEPLVETHNRTEIAALQGMQLRMVGINNRDIIALEMDNGGVTTTEELARYIDPGILVISESAIYSRDDVERAAAAGAHAVLVGTAILQAGDPAEMYRQLSEIGTISYDKSENMRINE